MSQMKIVNNFYIKIMMILNIQLFVKKILKTNIICHNNLNLWHKKIHYYLIKFYCFKNFIFFIKLNVNKYFFEKKYFLKHFLIN